MRIFGHQYIEKKANILGESTITIINKKVISLILIHCTERCRKNLYKRKKAGIRDNRLKTSMPSPQAMWSAVHCW